jgi:hypothetical protein
VSAQGGGDDSRFLILLNELSDSSPIFRWNSSSQSFVLLQSVQTKQATSAVFFASVSAAGAIQPQIPELYLVIAQVPELLDIDIIRRALSV